MLASVTGCYRLSLALRLHSTDREADELLQALLDTAIFKGQSFVQIKKVDVRVCITTELLWIVTGPAVFSLHAMELDMEYSMQIEGMDIRIHNIARPLWAALGLLSSALIS